MKSLTQAATGLLLALLSGNEALAEARAIYLANAGVLIEYGEQKIAFDPLNDKSYDQYQLLPPTMKDALMAGAPPFDNLDAIFVSHYHGDHFSPEDVLRLLQLQPAVHLFAPAQAVSEIAGISEDDAVFSRITNIELRYRDAPVRFESAGIVVEAVRIPHSGWPDNRADVENIAFRVTLHDEATVLHLGDADTEDLHFAQDAEFWRQRHLDLALPPYWYFRSESGRQVLAERLRPAHAVGVHVPERMPDHPDARPAEMRGFDLFTEPGEERPVRYVKDRMR